MTTAILSDYLEGKIIDYVLRGGTFASPASVYLGLFTASPSDAGGGTEVSGGATSDPYCGMSSGPHLHFEYRLNNPADAPQVPGGYVYGAVDPYPRLISHNYDGSEPQPLFKAECIVKVLNKRSGPGMGYALVGAMKQGDVVNVFEVKDNWFKLDPRQNIWCSGYTNYMKKL